MATHTSTFEYAPAHEFHATGTAAKIAVLIGRLFFAAIFLMAAPMHFMPAEIGFARSLGLPAAGFLVPAAGILAGLGGLSILLGYHARIGAWLIVSMLGGALIITQLGSGPWSLDAR